MTSPRRPARPEDGTDPGPAPDLEVPERLRGEVAATVTRPARNGREERRTR